MLTFRSITQKVSAVIGALNNILLIILIIFKSPKNLGSYKYLMIYISTFEVVYSVLDFLSMAELYSKDSYYIIIIDKDLTYLPECTLLFVDVSFCSLFGVCLIIFAAHFVYRYLVISGSKLIQKHHTKKVIALIALSLLVGVAWSLMVRLLLGPNEYTDSVLRKGYLPAHNLTLEDIVYVGAHFHMTTEDGVTFLNWKSFFCLSLMVVIIISSFSTVIYFGHKIYSKMTTMMLKSSSSRSLQCQLFWALVVQTLIPVICMHFPISIAFLLTLFNKSIELMGEIPTITIFLYPALDPLPNFFIIQDFRNAVFAIICCRKEKKTVRSLASSEPASKMNGNIKLRTIRAANIVTMN